MLARLMSPVAAVEILSSLLAVWVLMALNRRDPDSALRYWAVSFALQAVTTATVAHKLVGPELPALTAVGGVAAGIGAMFLVWGTLKYLQRPPSRAWVVAPAALLVVSVVAVALELSFTIRATPIVVALGGSLIFVGIALLRDWSRAVGARVAGLGLTLYGLHSFDYVVVAQMPRLLPWGHALAAFLQVMICVGFVLLYFERARARLAQQEAHYRALFENAVVGIFVARADGTLLAANRSLEGLIAGSGSLDGRDLRAFFEQASDFDPLFEGSGASTTLRWKADDGRLLDVQVHTRRVEQPEGAVIEGVVVDVTRMAHLERHLDQVQRAAVLGQLAGGIAHDINNVLTVVLANAEMLSRTTQPRPETSRLVDGIRQATQQGAGLTRQLLTFTRRHPAVMESFELGPRVGDAVRMLEPSLGEQIVVELDLPTTGCGIHADPRLVEQLVVNLVINARDAMTSGGRLTVRVEATDASHSVPAAERVVLEVTDTGMGMTPETAKRVFEPFFSTKEQGTGLGLAVVQRVVEQSSGTISLDSEEARGTTFRVSFPKVQVDAGAKALRAERGSGAGVAARVLVVEDREDVRDVIRETMREAGFNVIAPETPGEAIAQLNDGLVVDLLITDVRMPDFSGPQVADALHARSAEVPVIFVSGYSDEEGLLTSRDPNLVRFIPKPFTPDALVGSARELLALACSSARSARRG
jgi:PAS domain S-box-containing protein